MASTTGSLVNKFRGCLVGGLVGDCLGQPFEGEALIAAQHINNYFRQLMDPKVKVPYKPYTDDTAMAKNTALSLIHCKGFNAEDLARRYTTEYFAEPKRGYGSSIHDVFVGLRNSKFEDPFRPAQRQFEGLGSFGNGAAMRVSPVGLFCHASLLSLIKIATLSSKITHSNTLGYRGAILQSLAVEQALHFKEDENFDRQKYLDDLIAKMREVESGEVSDVEAPSNDIEDSAWNTKSYALKLEKVKDYIGNPQPPPLDDIQNVLGVHVSAIRSVPTAVYCYLAGLNPIEGVECENTFQRVVQFAISLGGDTDTIGCMAGSIAGAHLGFEAIPKQLLIHCEAVDTMLQIADDLHAVCTSTDFEVNIQSSN